MEAVIEKLAEIERTAEAVSYTHLGYAGQSDGAGRAPGDLYLFYPGH